MGTKIQRRSPNVWTGGDEHADIQLCKKPKSKKKLRDTLKAEMKNMLGTALSLQPCSSRHMSYLSLGGVLFSPGGCSPPKTCLGLHFPYSHAALGTCYTLAWVELYFLQEVAVLQEVQDTDRICRLEKRFHLPLRIIFYPCWFKVLTFDQYVLNG